ncbi:putative polyketide synthase protein [Botrytis cinerea BcDW1]|uniref:Putative polyketide synthase protein n=1 Tax=Botryotinia fuckeliana (strain BcDW1) TaxID=1290391 RepID=M7UIQ4_BOTF1|nr:putative polyketide synthase protein [Botrytis cinerea BcDW1]
MSFLIFGDQSLDTHTFLTDFCQHGRPSMLSRSFLEQAGSALREEIDRLPSLQRNTIPEFSTILELNKLYHAGTIKNPAVDSALLCIAQLSQYIDRHEKEHGDSTIPSETCLVGLCTGLFAAAAIASSPSISQLIPIAVQVMLMSFRTGAYVAALANRLDSRPELPESWTYVVPAAQENEVNSILGDFHKENVRCNFLILPVIANSTKETPILNQAYISATTSKSIAISGPPSTLKSLFASEAFQAKPVSIPVYGPYHAAHLRSSLNVEQILHLKDKKVRDVLGNLKTRFPVISCTTGTWYTEQEPELLLQAILLEMLTEPIIFNKILQGCVQKGKDFQGRECLIIPFGPTSAAKVLAAVLESQTELDITLRSPQSGNQQAAKQKTSMEVSPGKCKLAIVGMAGRFPDAASHEKLWELLENGLDVHREVPKDRFDVATHFDPTSKIRNTSHTPYGCWIENPGLFDPRFFNMSPREAYQTCPMQRLGLATAYEALEMAGYVPNRTHSTKLDRIGTFYGQTSDDWREINAAQDVDTYFITGGVRAFGPGRINYHFGFSGPSFNIDTACSSSAAALQLACTSLWAGDCDTAVVGGLSCMTNPDIFSGLSRGQFLSKNGPCATFDHDADGYCRADGIGTVIIKRLDYALADKDNVLAVILGSATNHSADAVSITHPHGGTQEILYKRILNNAGVDPNDIDYVEMHGTGTQAGDGTEMKSVTNVFAPADRKRRPDQPLYLGAVKANVGHGEAASGVTALIKCLMMLQKNAIPPHVGIKKTINQGFPKDLAERNVHIAFKNTPLPRKKSGAPRRIFVNNFSAAGGNTGLLLEDAPDLPFRKADPRSTHVIAITAKSKSAMLNNAERLISYLERNRDINLADLAYTTTARRIQHKWRMTVTASEVSEVSPALKSKLHEQFIPVLPEPPKVAFLFTGQGSQYAAMGRELFENSCLFKETIMEFDNLATILGFPSFISLIDGSVTDAQGLSPVVVQLSIVCLEMTMAKLWESWGVKPSVVIGHSLGEYAALNVAGILSASDTIYLVGRRAQLLVERCTAGTHAMLAVQGSRLAVTEALNETGTSVNIACINSTRETVLSGEAAEVSSVSDKLCNSGFKCTQLKVPFAFHSAQVEPILDQFEKLATSVHFGREKIPLISSLFGRCLNESEDIDAAYLRNHARQPVNFLDGLVSAQSSGVIDEKTVWIEVGPHPVCLGLIKATVGTSTIAAPSLRRNESAYKTLSNSLSVLHTAGLEIDWNEYHRDFNDSVHLLNLPTYAFDDKNYWIQYAGDWCLTKGQLPNKTSLQLEPPKPKLSTSTIHTVVSEHIDGDVAVVTAQSDLARADLRGVVTGHLVNGAMLCPSSLFADMSMTLCEYGYKLLRPDVKNLGVDVGRMKVPKSLIADPDGKSQVITLTATINAANGRADLIFSTGTDKTRVEHANCQVYFGDTEEYHADFQRTAYLIQSRIDWLQEAERSGKASKINRGLAYKLFAALVDYDQKYQGMEEVILDSMKMEATSRVVFQTTEKDGTFRCSPYWIDSVAHISGFIVNGSDAVDSREKVYISHGWDSLKFSEPLSADKTYRSYVRMQQRKDKTMAGDVYVFDGDTIIGMVGGLAFQAIPRKVLNMFLPPVGVATAVSTKPSHALREPQASKASNSKTVKKAQVTKANLSKVNEKLMSITSQVMDILAAEVGVKHDELVDNVAFTDLGADSLMALTVCGRLREEMDIDINSNEFINHPTIGAFKSFLSQFEGKPSVAYSEDPSSPVTTPSPGESVHDPQDDSEFTDPSDDDISTIGAIDSLGDVIRVTIAEEMSVDVLEVASCPDLASLGMDSLMALTVLGRLREKTGLSLPPDLFQVNQTIRDIEKALKVEAPSKPKPKPKSKAPSDQPRLSKPTASIAKPSMQSIPQRIANSILLQGNLRKASKYLWMVPDGGGSATSYIEIPALSSDVAVFGLNSPYMKTPEEFTCGVVGMATHYIKEMKRRQPTGPYTLSGWSAGGVIAYEIVSQLTKNDEIVDKLILLDSPCPDIIEPLPSSLHRWFAEIGLLGDGDPSKIPEWLLPHFAASVQALSTYMPEAIDPKKVPQVMAIWCEDGVCKLPTDPRPDPFPYGHAQFLLDNRTDFGPNIWDKYLGNEKFVTRHMPGNHFSMMHTPHIKLLGDFMREALTM